MTKKKLFHFVLTGSIALSAFFGMSSSVWASSFGGDIAERAERYIGYKITDFNSVDFVSYVFKKEGVELPANLSDLSKEGTLILGEKDLQIGDVLFFGTSRTSLITAGIYTGEGKFIVAYKPYDRIKEMDLSSSVAQKYYLGAKRITPPAPPKPAWEVTADKVIAHGMHHLGTDYKLGADYDRDGSMMFDCSSFTEHMFEEGAGFSLYRTSRPQFLYDGNKQVTRSELRKGDLVFFMTMGNYEKYDEGDYRRNGHVGIVKEVHDDGSIDVLHTYKPGIGVTVQTMDAEQKNFMSKMFLYGKRIIADDGTEAKDVTMQKVGLKEGM
ncbi:C40 family peptidase [Ammoniphilus sp. 3BR4]|uniref:C40 family peptidase n=1 Tax=Ammoniphilus sp. 3BR4 TaxID=3158265 RepID=UPI003467E5B2